MVFVLFVYLEWGSFKQISLEILHTYIEYTEQETQIFSCLKLLQKVFPGNILQCFQSCIIKKCLANYSFTQILNPILWDSNLA